MPARRCGARLALLLGAALAYQLGVVWLGGARVAGRSQPQRPPTQQPLAALAIIDQPPPSPPAQSASEREPPAPPRLAPFPVLMLAHRRPTQLNKTLASLFNVRGLNRSEVFVVQDGNDRGVSAILRTSGVRHIHRNVKRDVSHDAARSNGGERISAAYHSALSMLFDELTTDEAVIVVEDDLLFAADLMEYMLAGWAVMRADPSIWCVSGWNDNGFEGLVRDPKAVLRTGHFPGLGWLLSRRIYEEELAPRWPAEHWDHWMRSERVHRTSRGRECLIPHVPRTFHHGAVGTFMDVKLHEKYFARIALCEGGCVRWPAAEWPRLVASLSDGGYESVLRRKIADAAPIRRLDELKARPALGETSRLVLWDADAKGTLFAEIAALFGIWHDMRRGNHRGVHELWCAEIGPRSAQSLLTPRAGRMCLCAAGAAHTTSYS